MDTLLVKLISSLIKKEISDFKNGDLHTILDSRIAEIPERKPIRGIDGQDGKSFSFEEHGPQIKAWVEENRLKFSDLTEDEKLSLRGESVKGRDGRDGRDGHDFIFEENSDKISEILNSHLSSLKDSLKLKFSDLTEDEIQSLTGKDGTSFSYEESKDNILRDIQSCVESIKNDLKLKFSDLSEAEIESITGPKGRDGRDFKMDNHIEEIRSEIDAAVESRKEQLKLKFDDLSEEEKLSLRGPRGQRGRPGKDFVFEEHKEYFDSLRMKFEDLTADQKLELALTFDKLTDEQRDSLKLKFEDLTEADRQSIKGPRGQRGRQGLHGLSAYELAVQQGFSGTQEEWIVSLKGEKGQRGIPGLSIHGKNGLNGRDGKDGRDGADGRDAPYITDIEVNYYRDEITFDFIFSDGRTITTDRIKLPKQVHNFHSSGFSSSGSGGGASTLNTLTDVQITAPQVNDALVYNGTKWVNSPVTASGGSSEVDGGFSNSVYLPTQVINGGFA